MPAAAENDERQEKSNMEMDLVLNDIGNFGKYQKLMFFAIFVPVGLMTGVQSFKQVLLIETPRYWCRSNKPSHNQSHCYINRSTVSQQKLEEQCDNGWEYDKTFFKSTVVTEWDLVCNYQIIPYVAQFAINFGGMLGSILFGYLTDRWGRRKAFLVCLTNSIVFEICSSVAPHYVIWIISRFLAGLSLPAMYQITFILCIEIFDAKWRDTLGVILYVCYSIGLVLLSGVAYCVRDWRQLSAITSAPFLLLLGCWKYVDESPRWFLSKGKLMEAAEILTTMAKANETDMTNYNLQGKLKLCQMSTTPVHHLSVIDLFRTSNMKKKTLLLTFCWVSNMVVYSGLSLYGPSMGSNPYLCFALAAAVELPSHAIMVIFVNKWPRRISLCILMIIGGTSCIAITPFPANHIARLALYLISKFAISATYLIVYTFGSELYPTEVRGLGLGLASNVGMLANSFLPFLKYIGIFSYSLPLLILGICACLGGILVLALPETLNRPLPQTLTDGEEFGKNVTFLHVVTWFKCKTSINNHKTIS